MPPYKGGISRLVGLLSEGLKRQGHEVDILDSKITIKFKELKISSIPFHSYNDYDIIHLHGPTPFLSDLILMTNHKTPIIYTHHAEICWLSEKISEIYRGFHQVLAKRSRAIIVHSHDYAHLFKGTNVFVVRMPSVIKHHGNFDIKKKAASFTVLYVGQFRPFKGIEVLVQAASLLRDVNFVFVGSGYLKSNLERMIENLKNVRFVGAVSDEELMRLYKQAHVICLPSINTTEAYGLVLIEGALYGCVPLASNLIGVRENVAQLNGLLFEPGSYMSLSKKIRTLTNDTKLWVDFANRSQNAACNYVSTYTPEYYVKKHEALFRTCL